MFQLVSVLIALVGSSIAGAYDLKTTEIPDWASIGLIVLGLGINLLYSVLKWESVHILQSASVGAAFFAFGLLMYFAGQWGGGDVKVLAGIGTLIPVFPDFAPVKALFPFPFVFLLNLFLIGAAYIIVYAFAVAFFQEGLMANFRREVRGNYRKIIFISLLPLLVLVLVGGLTGLWDPLYNLIYLVPGILALLLLLRFLKVVEDQGFKEEVKTEDLKVGDMLANRVDEIELTSKPRDELREISVLFLITLALPLAMYLVGFTGNIYFYLSIFSVAVLGALTLIHLVSPLRERILRSSSNRIRGLEEEEVQKLQEIKDKVEVREGVRFAPVFPAAILASLYLGNLLLFIL